MTREQCTERSQSNTTPTDQTAHLCDIPAMLFKVLDLSRLLNLHVLKLKSNQSLLRYCDRVPSNDCESTIFSRVFPSSRSG